MGRTTPQTIKLNDRILDLSTPVVMGILNATPDSFFSGNRFTGDRAILQRAEKILSEGGTIIDIGGYSTRPDAEDIGRDEELRRVSVAIELILKKFPDALISVDTFRAGIARELVKNYQIAMVNDIGGGTLDDLMFETIAELGVAYVLMHTRGTPKTMQGLTNYADVVADVLAFLQKRLARLRSLGVVDVVVDPGFGFAKTVEQNFQLLKGMAVLQELGAPVLAGLSRKSMFCKLLNVDAAEALNATTVGNVMALERGASILRVHDVREAVEAIKIYNYFSEA